LAYGEATLSALPQLMAAIDSYVRENGVSDALLRVLAPAAKGDTIMLISVSGRAQRSSGGGSSTQAALPPSGRGGGGRGGRRMRGGMPENRGSGSNEQSAAPYTLSASFYAIEDAEAKGLIELEYTGSDGDEAQALFRERLDTEFPGSHC